MKRIRALAMTTGSPADLDAAHAAREHDLGLDAFVRDHYARLIRLAGLICHRTADAEDAVQAGLERAWRRREGLRDAERIRPWIDRIVVREALRATRRRTMSPLFTSTVTEIRIEPTGRDLSTDWAAMTAAYERLTPSHRAVIALHLYAGYSVAESAAILGVPPETVRSRLRTAKGQLRDQLGEAP